MTATGMTTGVSLRFDIDVLTGKERIGVEKVGFRGTLAQFAESSTAIRVPRITGLPSIKRGFTSMRV